MFRKKREKEPCLHNWELQTKTYGKRVVKMDNIKSRDYSVGGSTENSEKSTTTSSRTTLLYLCSACGEFKKIELAGEEIKS